MNILLLGYGKSSLAIEKYFKNHAHIDIIHDENEIDKLYKLEPIYDYVFRSPGIKASSKLVEFSRILGKCFTNELSYVCKIFTNPIKIVVTGSNGKTSLVTMINYLLTKYAPSFLGGNIGITLLDKEEEIAKSRYLIIEASSFQLEEFSSSIDVGIIKNLKPNHLDHVLNEEYYFNSKKRLKLFSSYFIEGEKLKKEYKNYALVELKKAYPSFPFEQLKHFDESYLENIIICLKLIHYLKLDEKVIYPYISNIPDVPHRREVILRKNQMTFIDDGKSSTSDSTKYAFEQIKNKRTLILGGIHKSNPFHLTLKKDDIIYIYGKDREKIFSEIHAGILVNTLKEALNLITYDENRTVLFSPGCASFDQYDGYESRCKEFKEWVNTWIK